MTLKALKDYLRLCSQRDVVPTLEECEEYNKRTKGWYSYLLRKAMNK